MYRQVHVNYNIADPKFYAKLFGVEHCEPRKTPRRLKSKDVFVYDVHEIEAGVSTDEYHPQGRTFKRYTSYLRRHPLSRMFVDLSSENISLSMGVYRQFLDQVMDHVQPAQVIVACSQRDILTQLQYRYPGIQIHHYNYWETYTRFELDERGWPDQVVPTKRFSCLNRRYAAHRAWLLYLMRDRIRQDDFVYTFSQDSAWTDTLPAEHVRQELQTLDEDMRNQLEVWQRSQQPWRKLNCEFSYFNHDTVWHTVQSAQCNIVTETVIHTRTQRASAFLTEKTFTPIALGRALVLYGARTANWTLQKEYGYQPTTNLQVDTPDWCGRAQRIAENLETIEIDWSSVQYNLEHFVRRTNNPTPTLPETQ